MSCNTMTCLEVTISLIVVLNMLLIPAWQLTILSLPLPQKTAYTVNFNMQISPQYSFNKNNSIAD